nr:MAG TPA: hypothetical protein [Caudoviricetes sp.]
MRSRTDKIGSAGPATGQKAALSGTAENET